LRFCFKLTILSGAPAERDDPAQKVPLFCSVVRQERELYGNEC
jgi:hypothetical protein